MQSLSVDSTDEDGLGPFVLILGEDKAVVVVWRKNSTKIIDNQTVWAASVGRWESISSASGGIVTGEEGEWEPQLFIDGVETTYQSRSGDYYKLGKKIHVHGEIVFNESVVEATDIEIKNYPFPTKHAAVFLSAWWGNNQVIFDGSYIMGENALGGSILSLTEEQLLSLTIEEVLSLTA